MGALDYFLSKKWQGTKHKPINNERYTAIVLSEDGANPNFHLNTRLATDRYLFDYMNAFGVGNTMLARSEINLLEILSLLLISKELEETNPKKISKTILELSRGRRPKNREEIRIINLIEAIALIETENFAINRDNYDVIVHILFRNLGYDIENKTRFYRQTNANTFVPNVLDYQKIDKTLNQFLGYMTNLDDQEIGGFTQALIILISFIYISPYQQNNLLLAFLLSKWYLQTINKGRHFSNPIYPLLYDWKLFQKLVKETFDNQLKLDDLLDFLYKESINGINLAYQIKNFDEWIESDPTYRHVADYLLPNVIDKVIALRIIQKTDVDKGISSEKLLNSFRLRGKKVFEDQEIHDVQQRLLDQKIISKEMKNGGREWFKLTNSQLHKLQKLLEEQRI
ncbi:hypothetical protein JN01_0096 [Entomoplasma freundtii]|uniref:Uncharacterized protein n=1 Tax=Entomoplasma freundtii TaxID=74700 RepID=A0A2K8NVM4_9MOLU|nr:hypothetical protein [Entomoplasma freundtii]ATZ16683.1 hypothetical protein EFREU_v1c06630 [Entomoplasma freundtii]TDY58150.1 hypothetical protein JN01_0096 [Entomoplasma freundtii]